MSDAAFESLLDAIDAAVRRLPRSLADRACDALSVSDTTPPAALSWIGAVGDPAHRELLSRVVRSWQSVTGMTGRELAVAIRAAAHELEREHARQSVELVWTGPTEMATLARRTDQALLEVVAAARETLYVVSFVAYKVPAIVAALTEAAARGVRVILVLESDANQRLSFSPIGSLGPALAAASTVYEWPHDRRPRHNDGRTGSLHVKCALADDDCLLISSANLTEFALNLNMELGMLVRGGDIPQRVGAHLRGLIESGVLRRAADL